MSDDTHTSLPFMKMHGLGNDFVILDARETSFRMTAQLAKAMGHRHFGVGFDQLAIISASDQADAHLTFYNSDGSQPKACGNATRCVARYLMDTQDKRQLTLMSDSSVLHAEDLGDRITAVNMGQPQLTWSEIPLVREMDTLCLPIEGGPTATGMGNPHCTFFVDDIAAVELETLGPRIEHHPIFPERTNVQAVQLLGPDHLRLRVWERGAGVTLASGSSSCAAAVAAVRRGLTGRKVRVDLDGGALQIDWRADGVWMMGPTQHVFDGVLTADFLDNLI
ncbi:MAG: diaminopimelate epimerase [Pseudomonadota bacterium]